MLISQGIHALWQRQTSAEWGKQAIFWL